MTFTIITPIINKDLLKPQFDLLLKSINKQKISNNIKWLLIGDRSSFLTFKKIKNIHIKFRFLIKTGNIYQCLNHAIKSLKTKFYLFIGADDYFLKNSFKLLNNITQCAEKKKFEIIIFKTNLNNNRPSFSWGNFNLSGGMLINKRIHKKFGYFSENYKIASDFDFYLRLKKKDFEINRKVLAIKKKICKIGIGGISSMKYGQSILEKVDIEKKFKTNKSIIIYLTNLIIYLIILVKKI